MILIVEVKMFVTKKPKEVSVVLSLEGHKDGSVHVKASNGKISKCLCSFLEDGSLYLSTNAKMEGVKTDGEGRIVVKGKL